MLLLFFSWYCLEVDINHNQPSASLKLYVDPVHSSELSFFVELPLKNGRVTKRLIYCPKWFQRVRIQPIDGEGEFPVKHLRLVWVPPWFAHDRLAQRLANMHPLFRDMPKAKVLAHIKQTARNKGVSWREEALRHYEHTFRKHTAEEHYAYWRSLQPTISIMDAKRAMDKWSYKPLVSIILRSHQHNPKHLPQSMASVAGQIYPHLQLCFEDGEDLNSALESAKGEFVALLDHDDLLSPDALFQVVKALQTRPDAGLLYSDEDKINEAGERFEPHFKPQWNPDLLLAQNYVSHLGVYRTSLVREVGGFRKGLEGSQDHDLVLRISQRLSPSQVVHIPHVLYHWRATAGSTALSASEKNYTSVAGLKAVRSYLDAVMPQAQVRAGQHANTYRVAWPLPSPPPLVSLLVPTRDKLHLLQPCVDAILKLTSYPHFELLILDNQSTCRQTLAYMHDVAKQDPRVRVLRWDAPFNYSAINNFGVANARGSVIGLVNNDIEPINPEWLEEMVRQVCRPDIGCVGAKLYYPNDTIQHAGVVLGIGGVAGHSQNYFSRNALGYFGRLHLAHNVSAVTGACLLVRKAVYQQVGGLDEQHLKVSFNDVDLCIKVREAGYRNLFTPYAELYHHESVSRGPNDTRAKRAVADAEAQFMRQKWGKLLDTDPYYNPNLTLVHEDFSLG